MVKIFLFEFVTGGGWWRVSPNYLEPVPSSLATEGQTMVQTLAEDLAKVSRFSVTVLQDSRLDFEFSSGIRIAKIHTPQQLERELLLQSQEADRTVLIAPEIGSQLIECYDVLGKGKGTVLSCNRRDLQMACDKFKTAIFFAQHKILTPTTSLVGGGMNVADDDFFPIVVKPRFGAGSLGVQRFDGSDDTLMSYLQENVQKNIEDWICQSYHSGTDISVLSLCGPSLIKPLAASYQKLADHDSFQYTGGSLPVEPKLEKRAQRLAVHCLGKMERPLGFMGVDMVLGECDSGKDDYVIEINPRLTTSYLGLRELYHQNLAEAMVEICLGNDIQLTRRDVRCEFGVGSEVSLF